MVHRQIKNFMASIEKELLHRKVGILLELALGQVMLIIGCMAFAENSLAFRNNIRRRRNKPELDSGKRWIFYIRWLVIWELIFGIVTDCKAWRNVVDFGNLYLGYASYREEKDNIIEYQEEEKRDDKGKYYLIHCVERYRIKKMKMILLMYLKKY